MKVAVMVPVDRCLSCPHLFPFLGAQPGEKKVEKFHANSSSSPFRLIQLEFHIENAMRADLPDFSNEEMAIDEAQGFPKAYAWLCSTSVTNGPFANGPPSSFIPNVFQYQEALKLEELNRMFPVIDQEGRPPPNLRNYDDFLWVQLDHLGNAGFDPAWFRVDRFGNVVYRHADSSSPLAWDIDHWFPVSRGGKTVPSNLRILQWQVCKKKKNKLDFLIPWWDLQLGISVNQFLSIFASRNSAFRSRAFSFFFPDRGEGLECLQNFNLHGFPQKFLNSKKKLGLAPATVVSSQNSSEKMVLKAIDLNRPLRHKPPFSASMESFQKEEDVANIELQRYRSSIAKENNQSALDGHINSPYHTISSTRDSLKLRKEARKQQEEISRLVGESNKLMQQNDIEQTTLLELEAELSTARRRVEKFRHLSETQASYRSLLEKMIRDVMHQVIVYKENITVNEAASQALLARLEAQRANCDSCEGKLYEIYKEREELEIRVLVCSEQALKRPEIYDDFHKNSHHLSSKRRVIKKELRKFLEEEQKGFDGGISLSSNGKENSEEESKVIASIINEENNHCQSGKVHKIKDVIPQTSKLEGFGIRDESYKRAEGKRKQFSDHCSSSYAVEEGNDKHLVCKDHDWTVNNKLRESHHIKLNVIMPNVEQKKVGNKKKEVQKSGLEGIKTNESQRQWNLHPCSHKQPEETEEQRILVGKQNVEKWLQILLGNAKEGAPQSDSHST